LLEKCVTLGEDYVEQELSYHKQIAHQLPTQ